MSILLCMQSQVMNFCSCDLTLNVKANNSEMTVDQLFKPQMPENGLAFCMPLNKLL